MIFLGIDPGLQVSGYCILKKSDRGVMMVVDYGYLKMSSTHSISSRVSQFYTFFHEKIAIFQVQAIVLETPFLGKNAQNFLKLGYLRGIIYLITAQKNIELLEYAPTEVKQAVTGFGGAKKDQVARALMQLFPKLVTPEKLDVTDAIAVALCGYWKYKMPKVG